MGVEFEDISGQPRSDEDIRDAIRQVEIALVKFKPGKPGQITIPLFMQLSTIREGLNELLRYRELMARLKKEKRA